MDELPPLPPGFTLEPAGDSLPPLPPGFTLEQPAPPAQAPQGAAPQRVYITGEPPTPAPASKAYTGKVLPFSRDEGGTLKIDPRAGIMGGFLGLPELAGDVAAGRRKVDVNDPKFVGDVVQGALQYGPKPVAGLTTTANAPSTSGLRNAATEGLQAYRDSNQLYNKAEYEALLNNIRRDLKDRGLNDTSGSASHAHKTLDNELQRIAQRPLVTSGDVDRLRVALGNSPKDELAGGMQAREHIMSFIESNNPGDAGKAVREAVSNYRQGMRSEFVEDALKKQTDKATAKNTTPNAEQIRTNIANLINSKETKNWSPEDTVGLNAALKSTPTQRAAQTIGKLAPKLTAPFSPASAGVLGAPAAVASYVGASHPVAAGIGAATLGGAAAVGSAARSYANRGARALADEASEAVRRNSPLARSGVPQLSFAPSSRNNITRAIVAPQLNAPPSPPASAWQQLPEGGFIRKLPDGTIEELS